MPRNYENAVILSDGRRVGYGLFQRNGMWYVRFVDGSGKRIKKSLGKPKPREILDPSKRELRQREAEAMIRVLMMVSDDVKFD